MYTATMQYTFKPGQFDTACELWNQKILKLAVDQAGFVRMQFLVDAPRALAIGTWKSKEHAEAFMHRGVFQDLMAELEPHCAATPVPTVWELRYFAGA